MNENISKKAISKSKHKTEEKASACKIKTLLKNEIRAKSCLLFSQKVSS